MIISRRGLFLGAASLLAAPAIVRASNLMAGKQVVTHRYWYTLRRWNPAWRDWISLSLGSDNKQKALDQARALLKEWWDDPRQGGYNELVPGHFKELGEPDTPFLPRAPACCNGVKIERVSPFTGMLKP